MFSSEPQTRNPRCMDEEIKLEKQSSSESFEGQINDEWSQGRACFGGLLLAYSARAAAHLVPEDRPLRAMNMTYVAPVSAGRIEIKTELLRSGGSVSHVSCQIHQEGQVATTATLSYGSPRANSLSIPQSPMPDVVPPEEGQEFPFLPPITPKFIQHLDYRWIPGHTPLAGAETAHVFGWIRPSIPMTVDAAQILALLDAYPPPLWSKAQAPFLASSLSSHFQILKIPDATENNHPWFLYDGPATVVGHGYSDVQARLWHEDGTLVAVGMQQFADFTNKLNP